MLSTLLMLAAPFAMPQIPEPTIPERMVKVSEAAAVQGAIDSLAAEGGGRVEIAAGRYAMKPIRLRSNIELRLEEGALLEFTDDPRDCLPVVMSSWEGLECMNYSPMVYVFGCTNVAITGTGTLMAKMDGWRRFFKEAGSGIQDARRILYTWGATDHPVKDRDIVRAHKAVLRPQLVQINRSKNVKIEGVELRDSPFWTCHLLMSEDVIVRGMRTNCYGFNNDGLDIEMTRNVLVENCTIQAGDDAFVFKAGRNRDAWRVGRPTENVEIRNCRVIDAAALGAVGSEMSGGVRNVWVHDCEVDSVARVCYLKTNHRRGGFIENIVFENIHCGTTIRVFAIETDVLYQWRIFPDYETRLTPIKDITVRNIVCDNAREGVFIRGDERLPVRNIVIDNVKIATLQGQLTSVSGAENVSVNGLVAAKRGPIENKYNDDMPLMPPPLVKGAAKPKFDSQWRGKRVAFLGDSITDPRHIGGCRFNYWNYLPDLLGIDAWVYGVNGARMSGVYEQAKRLMRDHHWYIDAIFVFAGTNDYNGNVPLGEWFTEEEREVNKNGETVKLKHREFSEDPETFRGRINRLLKYLKANFPEQQIVLMTPLHRGYATFGPANVQPDDHYSNKLGLYVEEYVRAIVEAGRHWSVPVIDLFGETGLLPAMGEYSRYFADPDRDNLHPNDDGHRRIADTMLYWMLSHPSDFKKHDGTFL